MIRRIIESPLIQLVTENALDLLGYAIIGMMFYAFWVVTP